MKGIYIRWPLGAVLICRRGNMYTRYVFGAQYQAVGKYRNFSETGRAEEEKLKFECLGAHSLSFSTQHNNTLGSHARALGASSREKPE